MATTTNRSSKSRNEERKVNLKEFETASTLTHKVQNYQRRH